jgi:gas vesicle protein
MRFVIGLLLGFAIGFAGAILFAPEKPRRGEAGWPEGLEEEAGPSGNHDVVGGLQRMVRTVQDHVNEAWAEAKQAADEAEKEMRARYEKAAGRTAGSRR